MYKAICFLGLFLLGCLSLQSHAQEMNAFSSTEIVHFSWQTYQAQRQNWSIAQHPETGFIYAGNSGGLLEYDGACWRTYSLPQKQVVRSLHISKDGKIYTGGLGEFGFWEPNTNGKLTYHSLKNKIPFLMISKSGGARMMEAGFSLMQMAKTSAKLALLEKAAIPYISLLTDPTTGGVTASYAMLGDFNIAEPEALIGFAGPRVIRETIGKDLPKGFQSSEFVLEHGFLDFIIDRRQLKNRLTTLLNLLRN